jgi:transposase
VRLVEENTSRGVLFHRTPAKPKNTDHDVLFRRTPPKAKIRVISGGNTDHGVLLSANTRKGGKKRSLGMKRAKTDKVDAISIAKYAFKNTELVRLWKPPSEVLEKIKHLATLKDRMVQTQKRLITPLEELRDAGQRKMADFLEKSIKKSIAAIDGDLKKIETKITECLKEDASLHHLFTLITSVVGIGFVTAINLIIHTQGFNIMCDSRKLACYCGVAPFPYQSGTSIRGKTKVSHMANKKLKTNLHMAALTAIRYDAELRAYYERKILEGKSKMSVINAVRFKLLARVVSVVKNDREYVKKTA